MKKMTTVIRSVAGIGLLWACSGQYLFLEGVTNNVAFTVKPRLPTFPAGTDFNLPVSIPGRAASMPAPKSVAEEYADANSRRPPVFEKKAEAAGHTIVTKEGKGTP